MTQATSTRCREWRQTCQIWTGVASQRSLRGTEAVAVLARTRHRRGREGGCCHPAPSPSGAGGLEGDATPLPGRRPRGGVQLRPDVDTPQGPEGERGCGLEPSAPWAGVTPHQVPGKPMGGPMRQRTWARGSRRPERGSPRQLPGAQDAGPSLQNGLRHASPIVLGLRTKLCASTQQVKALGRTGTDAGHTLPRSGKRHATPSASHQFSRSSKSWAPALLRNGEGTGYVRWVREAKGQFGPPPASKDNDGTFPRPARGRGPLRRAQAPWADRSDRQGRPASQALFGAGTAWPSLPGGLTASALSRWCHSEQRAPSARPLPALEPRPAEQKAQACRPAPRPRGQVSGFGTHA